MTRYGYQRMQDAVDGVTAGTISPIEGWRMMGRARSEMSSAEACQDYICADADAQAVAGLPQRPAPEIAAEVNILFARSAKQ